MTGRARDMIMDSDQTGRLHEVIAEGEYYGMQTFDQALLRHYQAGRVSMEDALKVASSPHDFKLLVAAEGRTSTTMADVGESEEQPDPADSRPADTNPVQRPVVAPSPGNGRSSAPPPGVAA
jgi:twitching motility protein PilT